LGVNDNNARPGNEAVFAEDLGVFIFLEVVGFGEERWEVEVRREDADAKS